jgi:antitoxin MazE
MSHATLGRWGKTLAVRLPENIASELRLREGEPVEIVAGPGQIVIRKAKPRYTAEELFAGKSPDQWRTIYANANDLSSDAGPGLVED